MLSVLEEAQDALCFKEPPCALLPLGTGNDLARVLHWGPGYSGEKVLSILFSVENADIVQLDRYVLYYTHACMCILTYTTQATNMHTHTHTTLQTCTHTAHK